MARIIVSQSGTGRTGRIKGYFHKLPLYSITRKSFENKGLSALSALCCFMMAAR